MLNGLSQLGHAYLSILNVASLSFGLGGALLGIMVGCLPGLSATLCIALLTTLTIKLPPNDAILILICSYVGTLYGGSRTAILLNIPGTAANAASCADGHALALRGEAGRAIGIATSGAFSGTLFGVLCLAAFTPVLAEVSLSFGAYEFFWLALLGVAMSGSIVGNDPLKGWLMGVLGLFVAQIGQEGLYAYDRFTFGWSQLSGGISLIPALIGAFGFAEVLTTLADPVGRKVVEMQDSVLPRFREVAQYWRTVLRSGVIGVLTGLMPGVGEDAGAWMSYAAAKAVSKEREQFGKGSIDGLMAAETGDMASIPGHIIPALALGIPGSAPSAVLMAAMIIHGIQPGPMLMIQHPQFIYDVVAMTSLATVSILVFGLFLIRPLLLVLRVKLHVLMPIIFVLCTVGAFAGASRLFDVYCMMAIGIGAFLLRRRGYQMAPFVLGLVLGGLLDKSLRRGLVLSDGSLEPFFTRPISLGLATVTIFILLLYIPAFKAGASSLAGAVSGWIRHLIFRSV
ncbi:tripartite tricarboxylate transporter permease [Bradyrhizobium erythrophlei]|jgi:putative tricarboxylic transport membrane protein|uniref:Putative tricarboxylic transport membrane protein n=1 Tax=Bradyrhizobium erythrophlei TaxID=1437360 RepID=A0A1M5RSQ5_9BRAD|nr:tripartite tricarboxylate transporter permease [Bradyrhizobium erythrophlei]SHH29276.1 putative tricarboxylic transport membrane protein [Bradyrhizobium erythrophlei]